MLKNILKQKLPFLKLNNSNLGFSSKKFFSTKGTESSSNASKEFEKKLNSVSKQDDEEFSSIEQYMKIFNDKIYKQNVELTNKLSEIFKEEGSGVSGGSSSTSGAKIFTAVNEINKINLNNSSKLLQVFLNQILKYNDSVRLFIQQSERKNTRFNYLVPLTLFFLWVCGSLYLYSFYKRNFINYDKLFDNIVKFYNDEAPKLFKINIKFPIYDDHKNVTNLLNFDAYKHIVLIGPHSIGKSESVKHFCLSQALKDVLSIYIDLNTIGEVQNFKNIVRNKLVENYKGNDISLINIDKITTDLTSHELFEFLKSKNVYFVFDNYNHERDHQKVFDHSIPSITNNSNWKSLIVSSNNEIYENATKNNLEVKYVNFIQTRTFKNYLVEKLNTFVKKRVDYSNLELFSEENINTLFKHFYYFSYDDLFRFIEANNSIQSKTIIFNN
jgi:hypothetical protein